MMPHRRNTDLQDDFSNSIKSTNKTKTGKHTGSQYKDKIYSNYDVVGY